MERILITGGSHSELPLIEAAHRLGFEVITTGSNRDGQGHLAADKYVYGDFSDMEFVAETAAKEKVSGIISGCNDFAYLSAAYACEKLGLPGHDNLDTARLIHNKSRFMSLLEKAGVRRPLSMLCMSEHDAFTACDEIGLPLVIKPTDLTGGKGVTVCRSREEIADAYASAVSVTRADGILAEEFIEGDSCGCSLMIKDHRVVCGVFGNEFYYLNKYLVSGACTAARSKKETREQLCSCVEKISHAAGLCDGLFHTQFIVTEAGEPIIIDPCRRAPGDLYIRFAQLVTGIDFPELIVRAELGIDFSVPEVLPPERLISRMCIMTDREGIIRQVVIPEETAKHVIDRNVWGKRGDVVEDRLKYKAGILFLEYDDPNELYRSCADFHKNVRIEFCG